MVKAEWYERPTKVWRDGEDMIVPANQVQEGDYVHFLGVRELCGRVIMREDEGVVYFQIGNNLLPVEMFDAA